MHIIEGTVVNKIEIDFLNTINDKNGINFKPRRELYLILLKHMKGMKKCKDLYLI